MTGLLPHFRFPVTPDVSWLLDAAGRMLDGAVLGRDVAEINPPLILRMKQLVVAGARMAGVHPERAWTATTLLLTILSSWLAARCVGRSESWRAWPVWLVAAVPCVLLLLIPRQDFGQREHLAVILVLPFLALRGARDVRPPPSAGSALAFGAAAGVGFCLKPFFLLVPLLLFTADARRLSVATALRHPEWLAVAAVPLLYAVSVIVWAREWLAYAIAHAPLYRAYLDAPLWLVPLLGEGAYAGWVFLAGWLALRRAPAAHAPLLDTLGLSTAGFQLAAVVQGKGWTYHFLPAALLGSLATVLLAHRIRDGRLPARILVAGMLATSAVLAGRGIIDGLRAAAGRDVRRGHLDPNLAALTAELRSLGGSTSV
ncbi:MAG TPA: hypothetical protein VFX50_09585, partial [Gemmatimonadales bacterium]|nr:hypothetical protein [Gemmatimonadales bacterium]